MAGTIAATIGRATSLTRRLTRIERDFARKVPLPETFPFRLEQVVPGQAAREAQEARVGGHPMRRTQASAAPRPASLQQLVYLQHPEAADLAQAVEKPLHLAHVRAEGEDDAARPERQLCPGHRLPGFGEIQQHAVEVPFVEAQVRVSELKRQVVGYRAKAFDDDLPSSLLELLALLVAHEAPVRSHSPQHGQREGACPRA